MSRRARFAPPAAIAGLMLGGLFAGLVGDGMADRVAAAALAVPFVALGWAWRTRRC